MWPICARRLCPEAMRPRDIQYRPQRDFSRSSTHCRISLRPPFNFGSRYQAAMQLIHQGVRTFSTTSMGRLFDAAAALLGFVRETTFEGQAAIWLEQLARGACNVDAYPFPFDDHELDFRPLLDAVIHDRLRGPLDTRNCASISTRNRRGTVRGRQNDLSRARNSHRCPLRRSLPE